MVECGGRGPAQPVEVVVAVPVLVVVVVDPVSAGTEDDVVDVVDVPDGADGWFCSATVVADLPADSPVLADEIFTPDSSRFWPVDEYAPGGPQPERLRRGPSAIPVWEAR